LDEAQRKFRKKWLFAQETGIFEDIEKGIDMIKDRHIKALFEKTMKRNKLKNGTVRYETEFEKILLVVKKWHTDSLTSIIRRMEKNIHL